MSNSITGDVIRFLGWFEQQNKCLNMFELLKKKDSKFIRELIVRGYIGYRKFRNCYYLTPKGKEALVLFRKH